jgi:hypothetical protein
MTPPEPTQRPSIFWARVETPPNPSRATGLGAPHWIGNWPMAHDGRRMQHAWRGHKNVNPARAAWEICSGTPLGSHRIYRVCDEPRCVNPAHHTAAKYDPFKDPEVLRMLVEGLPERKLCGRCGYALAPAGSCSHCRKEQRQRARERAYGRPEPPLPQPVAESPTNGHLRLLPPPEPLESLDDIMDDIFGVR